MKNNTLKRLLSYIYSRHKKSFILVIIFIFISSIASISVSLSLKYIVDETLIPLIGKINPSFSKFYKSLFILIIIFILGTLSSFLQSYLMVEISQDSIKSIRDKMFKHMQKLPIRYFDQNTNGSIMSIYTNDSDVLRQFITQSLPQTFSSIITIVFSFISMLILSPILSIISILSFLLIGFLSKIIGENSRIYFKKQQESIANLTGYIEERISGQKVIKVFNREEITKEEFDKLNEELYLNSSKANSFASTMGPIVGNIGNLQFVITAILGALFVLNNSFGISVGLLISYLQVTKTFSQPIMQIFHQLNQVVMAMAGAERIFNLLDEQVELDEGKVLLVNVQKDFENNLFECDRCTNNWAWKKIDEKGKIEYIELKGDVRFNSMTFSYNDDKIILENLNLYAKPGQKVAFVGKTGAGKTTITNLINRFYDVNEGSITYDGINVKDIKKSDLRRSLGIVLQETHLFSGTIMENIRYGKLNASDEEVYEAARLAHADSFIELLPDGFNTYIDASADELSQGQKQLLAIARAAISNPPVLILDEATSSIDTRTEKIVAKAMDNLMKGRTVFVIAHRLSTIKNSDVIILLENGKIIERGNHKDLMNLKGKYYQLATI